MTILARVRHALSSKPVSEAAKEIAVVLNREVIPVLRSLRDAVNAITADIEVPFGVTGARPSGGTTTSFQPVSVLTISATAQYATFDPSDYDDPLLGRTRAIYLRVSGMLGPPATADGAEFELYNATDATAIATVLSTDSPTPVIEEYGPISVGTGTGELPNSEKAYTIRSRRTSAGSDEALLVSAAFIVRYE